MFSVYITVFKDIDKINFKNNTFFDELLVKQSTFNLLLKINSEFIYSI